MSKKDHVLNGVTGFSIVTIGFGVAGVPFGSLSLASVVGAIIGAGAIGSDAFKFKPYSALMGALGSFAVAFGMQTHDLNQNYINVPINDNIKNATKIDPAFESKAKKVGETAVYDFAENVVTSFKMEQVKKDFCNATREEMIVLNEEARIYMNKLCLPQQKQKASPSLN